ncbi:MAG: glucose-6-phosphate dehydrogenase assembly protein OpcA [Actinomycetota bacterium]|nr:glucose-6-phosphate dehydrogenase assembly protein OpcA [Actinomycetota bacterium]
MSIEATGVWSEQGTTPGKIEAALRRLLEEQHAADEAYVPARVLNLVAVVDREWRGEIVNRLEHLGRFHPSRTIVCAMEHGRTSLDAWATMACDMEAAGGGIAVCEERVEIDVGPQHLERLATIVDPLLVPDLSTVVWSPHGHPEAVDALTGLADVFLIDSVQEPDPSGAVQRARDLLRDGYVVDLAWLRSAPWRERIAATFDPGAWRPALREIDAITIRHHPESAISGLLLVGWLGSRLGWEPGTLMRRNGDLLARARAKRHEVRITLEAEPKLNVPGLDGLTIECSRGMSLSLDRGAGGLSAKRRMRDGTESSWVVLGASRGEQGILGEGIRQALLRDPTYGPALGAAAAMLD